MAHIAILGAGYMGSALTVPATDNGHSVALWGTALDGRLVAAVRAGRRAPPAGPALVARGGALSRGRAGRGAGRRRPRGERGDLGRGGVRAAAGGAPPSPRRAAALRVQGAHAQPRAHRDPVHRGGGGDRPSHRDGGRPLEGDGARAPRAHRRGVRLAGRARARPVAPRAGHALLRHHRDGGSAGARAVLRAEECLCHRGRALRRSRRGGPGGGDVQHQVAHLHPGGGGDRAARSSGAGTAGDRVRAGGRGDLHVTAVAGRNRIFGELRGAGLATRTVVRRLARRDQLTEGYAAIRWCWRFAAGRGVEVPLLRALHRIVYGGRDVERELRAACWSITPKSNVKPDAQAQGGRR